MSDYSKLKELAEATKGWDNLKSCWPEETEDGDLEVNWFVGAVTEDDDKYPVLEVNTAQYDALEDAGRLARYYAAANPAAVLALIAENDSQRKDLQNLRSDNAQLIYALKQEQQSYLVLRAERDQLKTESEALRDDLEQIKYDANAWRNSEESVWIEVFNSEGDDPFICAISGQITVEQLALIQAEILEYREDYFEKGSGLYVFRCTHYQAHHDNVGMTEPAHWETDFESYSPFPWEEEAAAMGKGEKS